MKYVEFVLGWFAIGFLACWLFHTMLEEVPQSNKEVPLKTYGSNDGIHFGFN